MSKVFIAKSTGESFEFNSPEHRAMFKVFLKEIMGKFIRIEQQKNSVSDELRGYYYGGVLPTVQSVVPQWKGLSNEQIHEILKKEFNYFDYFNVFSKRNERVGLSAMGDSSNTEMAMAFIEKIRIWLADDYKQALPDPEEWKATVRDNPQML